MLRRQAASPGSAILLSGGLPVIFRPLDQSSILPPRTRVRDQAESYRYLFELWLPATPVGRLESRASVFVSDHQAFLKGQSPDDILEKSPAVPAILGQGRSDLGGHPSRCLRFCRASNAACSTSAQCSVASGPEQESYIAGRARKTRRSAAARTPIPASAQSKPPIAPPSLIDNGLRRVPKLRRPRPPSSDHFPPGAAARPGAPQLVAAGRYGRGGSED